MSSLSGPSSAGGLKIVHPTGAVPPSIVTGLGADLTGAGSSIPLGANCVVLSPLDDYLLVGEVTDFGRSAHIHQLLIVNGTVLVDVPVFVGTGVTSGLFTPQISQIAMLANGDAVFSVSDLDSTGPLGGAAIGRLNRATQSVSPIPIPMPAGTANAIAVDEANGLIYLGMWGSGIVWCAPLAGGTPSLLGVVSQGIWSMTIDENGDLLIAHDAAVSRVNAQNGGVLQSFASPLGAAVAIEQATADPITLSIQGTVSRVTAGGTVTIASNLVPHASGIIAIGTARDYGTATSGATDYAFQTFPSVGGLPIAGNASHALLVEAADGSNNLGVLVAGFSSASMPLLGFQLLVDPGTAVALGAFPAGTAIPFALPPSLSVTNVFLQSIHLDAGNPSGLAASRGLHLTTIQ